MAIDPMAAEACAIRGTAYGSLGRITEALADLDKSLDLEPANTRLYFLRGLAHRQLGNKGEAVSDLEYFIQTNPNAPNRELAEEILEELKSE